MKVLFEGPTSDKDDVEFTWTKSGPNRLAVREGKKKITILNAEEPNYGQTIKTICLSDGKECSCLDWSRDSGSLALLVSGQLYFWRIESDSFRRHQSELASWSPTNGQNSFEAIRWSRLTDRLLVCSGTGSLVIIDMRGGSVQEKQCPAVEGLISLDVCQKVDAFLCIKKTPGLQVMSFDGDCLVKLQTDSPIRVAKLSAPVDLGRFNASNQQVQRRFMHDRRIVSGNMIAFVSETERLHLKRLESTSGIAHESAEQNLTNQEELIYQDPSISGRVLNIFWLDPSHLILCFDSGTVILLFIRRLSANSELHLVGERILDIANEHQATDAPNGHNSNPLRHFSLELDPDTVGCFSFACISKHALSYYKLLKVPEQPAYAFERVDSFDLSQGLARHGLELAQLAWSFDNSMLASQLSNGHLFVYRARLTCQLTSSSGLKVAYMSGLTELTILDYSATSRASASDIPSDLSSNQAAEVSNALNVSLDERPTVIAIGKGHLAVATGSRVRLFRIVNQLTGTLVAQTEELDELRFASLVEQMRLSSTFIGILFKDGRLKLQSIESSIEDYSPNSRDPISKGSLMAANERFFPDPQRPEIISSYLLTDDNLIYSSKDRQLRVFNLKLWTYVQSYDYSACLHTPMESMCANKHGNKVICITSHSSSEDKTNVGLYDLIANKMLVGNLMKQTLGDKILKSQLKPFLKEDKLPSVQGSGEINFQPNLNRVSEAIWDSSNPSTMYLVEGRQLHVFVVLDHTLGSENSTSSVEYVCSEAKASSHRILYASMGVISMQTSLGSTVNKILESHDEVAALARLRKSVDELKDNDFQGHLKLAANKLAFFRRILLLYPLFKARDVCTYLTEDQALGAGLDLQLDQILWRQLAARAIYLKNLRYALMIYRNRLQAVHARILKNILDDICYRNLDADSSVTSRITIELLDLDDGCIELMQRMT